MKNLTLILLTIFLGMNAFASDKMEDEIVCNKLHQHGSADDGLTFVLKSNETSWVKIVDVIENGYLGPRLIASVQVPLQPQINPINESNLQMIVYHGNGLVLSIEAIESDEEMLPLTAKGEAVLALPGYPEEIVSLTCEYAQ